jgi:hypothetical protein
MRCASLFKITMGNLENGETITRPNATFNLAQVVRGNTFAGMNATLWFTHDHVFEHNGLFPAHCAYNGMDMPATPLDFSRGNFGLLYRG